MAELAPRFEGLGSDPTAFYSPDYASARERFRASALERGWALDSVVSPGVGPLGESLSIDVAQSPGPASRPALIVSSGLHGVEGPLGSAVQLAFLEREDPSNSAASPIRIVLIHALNPYGFAWSRRFDEANIDPNRNFLLCGQEYQGHPPGYAALDRLLNPRSAPARCDGFQPRATWRIIRHGMRVLKDAVAVGQYDFPLGLFFGGRGPGSTHKILKDRLNGWLDGASRIVHLDYHTGLGRWGTWKLLIDQPLAPSQRDWLRHGFGPDSFEEANSIGVAYEARGTLGPWCAETLQREDYLHLCAEFGSYGPLAVLAGLRAENQAHHWGEPDDPATRRAKRRLRELFCPASPRWRSRVLTSALALMEQALRSLDD
jgi:hypothetical protein